METYFVAKLLGGRVAAKQVHHVLRKGGALTSSEADRLARCRSTAPSSCTATSSSRQRRLPSRPGCSRLPPMSLALALASKTLAAAWPH